MSDFAEDTNVPTNDYISRQAAIDALWKALYEYEDKTEKQFQESEDLDVGDWIEHRIFVQNMNDIDRQTILNLPSVEPERKKGEWIPCSERLPEGDGMELKLVTYIDPREGPCVWLGWYEMEGVWYIDGDAHSKELGNEVTAWLNIPEPYEEAEQ